MALAEAQETARAVPAAALDHLALAAATRAASIELDEATTRVLIDEQLRLAGWSVDSAVLRHAAGARPPSGEAVAIEWPTARGPVDDAVFLDGRASMNRHCEARSAAAIQPAAREWIAALRSQRR